ncbi:MAG: metallophosphoesterase family protein [Planctomycetota bacterium]|jgi:predicted phosphodiesterase
MVVRADRVALIADIHGNAPAFEAVLEDLRTVEVDAHILLGDYFLFGPHPREVFERVRGLAWPAIEGNTDRYVAGRGAPAPFHDLLAWNRQRLGDDARAWIEGLPFDGRVQPADDQESDLLVVHATPTDIEQLLITEQDEWQTHPLTTEAEARDRIGDAHANLIVYGHIHYASSGTLAGRRLASIGAVGLPFDGDHRAAYAIASWDGTRWDLEHRRVSYDHESVVREIREQDAGLTEGRAARIEQARSLPLRPL